MATDAHSSRHSDTNLLSIEVLLPAGSFPGDGW
jgi:hypothetical protein